MGARWTKPLSELNEEDRLSVGAKAASLALLSGAGLPVPSGFCIPAPAYREHLARSGLEGEMKSLLEALQATSPEGRKAGLEELRERIVTAPLGERLSEEIEAGFEDLGAVAVAVRSSATAEDLPDNSFAGQYDTILDVTSPSQCLDAVKRCWASLWTERAFEYREKNGFDHAAVEMAVIVQEMVPADYAGVAFTADPVSGAADRVIIEAVRGLGESLVSGRATPDGIVLSKGGLGIISSHSGGNGSNDDVCMSENAARLLSLMAMRAESVFGRALDMEWAAQNGRIYLLQARPITALENNGSWEDRQVWSNFNTGEVLPDVVTPMSWSLVQILVLHIFEAIFGKIGISFGESPILGQVAGRAYFNINTMLGAMRRFPMARKMDVSQVLGGEHGKMEELGEIDIPEEDIPDLHFTFPRLLLKMPSFLVWMLANSLTKGEAMIKELKSQAKEMQQMDLQSMGDDEILACFDDVVSGLRNKDTLIAVAGKGMYFFMTLDKVCRRWLGDINGILANLLCSGLEGMDSAEAGFELWRLALEARRRPQVEAAIASGESVEATMDRISRARGGGEWLEKWRAFMAEHGHHAQGELEISKPRWSEEPDIILGFIRGYLRSMGKVDPLQHHRQNFVNRVELEMHCRMVLKDTLKRRIFDYYLEKAQRGSVIRENIKSEAVRHMAIIRGLLLELGTRMAERGILQRDYDVFFLSHEELLPVLHGESPLDVEREVISRRAEYERNLTITPPKVIKGKFNPGIHTAELIDDDVDMLAGLAVSPGVVIGPARVMLHPDSERVEPGEILVAPFTDPGWGPHFLTAAGIVMDMGGLLSHGSIVAREYGIPAVVNVGPATRIIKTGQLVQVDGTRGEVRILRR